MKRLFTLAIIAMIASLTFAQAPVQKMKASDKKVEKVASATQMSKAMEAKAAFDAKAKAAQETSGSVIRHAAKRPTAAAKQMTALKAIPGIKVARQVESAKQFKFKNAAEKNLKAPVKANISKMATAKTEDGEYDVELVATDYSAEYYASDGDWYCVLQTSAGPFRFDIVTNDPTPLNGTYTWDQMDHDYSWVGTQSMGWLYTDATFTVNADGTEVDASATLETGEKVHVTYTKPEAPEITAYQTYEFSVEQSELNDMTDSGLLQIIGDNGDQYASIVFYADQVAGTYTIDDMYGAYTNLYLTFDDYDGVKPFALNATITEEGATVIYDAYNGTEYTLIFHFSEGGNTGDEPGDVTVTKDANGIITSVEGGVTKTYTRSTEGTAYFVQSGSMYYGEQSGTATMIEDGDKVYMKNPISKYTQNSWVEGTKNGNMIVFPAGQPLAYNASYQATISMRYGVVDAAGNIAAADGYAENFVFEVDGDVLTLKNTESFATATGDAYFMGAFWDDDDSATGYGDAETVLTYDPTYVAPSTELVVLPNGAEVQPWTMNAVSVTSESSTPVTNQPVNVSFVGNDVYVQGIFEDFPTAWVKGTKSGSTVTFNNLQYIGNYGGSYDMYFAGTDGEGLTNATATLSSDAQTLTFVESLLANAATDRIYYLTWLENVVISSVPAEEPVITDLTATLPYVNGFDTDAEKAEAAIYDANGDGKTWAFANDTKSGSDAARYTYNSSKDGNDYVVFPGLSLKAGTSYKVTVDARSNSSYYPERIEVVAGTTAKASELTEVVVPATDLATGDYETLVAEFTPEADGVYYFALHAVSDADMFYLYADNFSVAANDPEAPKTVSDLEIIPDPEAALKATVKFTTPETTAGGDALDNVKVTVARDGEKLFDATLPAGFEMSVVDKKIAAPGNYTWTVAVATADGEHVGDKVSAKAYVGEDIPDDVENLAAADLDGKVGLTWDAPTEGVNGGIILPENLKYNVYPVEMVEFFGMQFPAIDFENPYATAITETNAEVDFDTNSGAQGYTYFGVTAENTAGETNGAMAAVLTGAPYELPIHEGLTGQALHYWWGTASDEANYELEGGLYIGTDSSDGDGVSFLFNAETEGWISMESGKIALNGAENPVLTFDYKADAACTLNVKVITPEGEENVGLMPLEASEEWATATIGLDFYADQPWVRFVLVGEFDGAATLSIDNVNVLNAVATDLDVKVSAPKTVVAGNTAVVKATVTNMGQDEAANYDVTFYVNDNEVAAPLFEIEPLAFFQTATYEFELATSVFDEAGDVVVKAVVTIDGDAVEANNSDECIVTIAAPSAAPVETVSAEQTTEGVVVSWTVAENSAAETTEDFESYEVGIFTDGATMGPWSGKDGDHGMGYGWNSSAILWDYTGEPYAFAIMNFPTVFGSATDIEATSGEQALMFMSVTDETGAGFPADDWFISPELPGVAQTISFQARPMTANYGPETLEVMASVDGQNWTKVASYDIEEEAFEEYTANLAEGTKYFALHYVSNDVFALFIDDLKYTVGGANPTGFNVYVDQSLVAALDAEARDYTYAEEISEGDHDFSVTAVYGNSESAPATVTLGVATGIQNINAASNVEVYTLDGIRINNVKNLKAGVYVVNGKKLVIK